MVEDDRELPEAVRCGTATRARAVAGSGIGLAAVRELVTAHGGTVTAASQAGAGTTVAVRLPLRAAAGARPAGQATELPAA
ncbi:MAG TPA: ATP-binding protein [Pilimelia sp.]|nr:ATP-binding protein [Pilimelia sp.]